MTLLAALLWWTEQAAAQAESEGPFAVIVADAVGDEADDPRALSAALRTALSKAGQSSVSDAESRLIQYDSKPPEDLPKDVMQRLREQIDGVTRDLAMGDLPKAVTGMEAIEGLHHQALAQLNREAEQARRLFTACVAMGVMLNDNGKPAESRTRLQHCAATFPGYRLSKDAFSPAAIKLYQEAVAGIDPVTLRVDNARPELSCAVRFNGLNVGTAPAQLRVQRGWASVQLECNERPGRVHPIMLVEEHQRLAIDPVLEYALTAEDGNLMLRYADRAAAQRYTEEHGLALTGAIRVRQALLAEHRNDGNYALSWLSHEGERALSRVTWDGQAETLDAAVQAMLKGPALAAKLAETPVRAAAVTSSAATDRTLAGLPQELAWAWPVLGLAWGGTLGLSFYALDRRADDREYGVYLLDPAPAEARSREANLLELQGSYDDLLPLTYALSITSNTLVIAGSILALPSADEVPLWAWVSGAAGLALAVSGFVILAVSTPCDIGENCVSTGAYTRDTLLPASLLIHAVGPLSVPLSYLVAAALGSDPSALRTRITASPSSAQLSLIGSF